MGLTHDVQPTLVGERHDAWSCAHAKGRRAHGRGRGCVYARGKYRAEVHSMVLHLRWLRCVGARYATWPLSLVGRWGGRARVSIVAPVGSRALPRHVTNRF
eukprot:1640908-Prymnesium_polylepis.1